MQGGNGYPSNCSKIDVDDFGNRIWDNFRIISHNINGIKYNNNKLFNLLEDTTDDRFNIVGLSETNLDQRSGNMLNKKLENYMGFGPIVMTKSRARVLLYYSMLTGTATWDASTISHHTS